MESTHPLVELIKALVNRVGEVLVCTKCIEKRLSNRPVELPFHSTKVVDGKSVEFHPFHSIQMERNEPLVFAEESRFARANGLSLTFLLC